MIQSGKEFYLTLLSNSSASYYPKNTATRFVTQLPQRIELQDDMECALFEIHYPFINNVLINANKVTYSVKTADKEDVITKTIEIQPGFYNSVSAIHHAVNSVLANVTGDLKILLTEANSFTRVDIAEDSKIKSVVLSDNLGLQLGFEPGMNIVADKTSPHKSRLNVGFQKQLLVYCDVFESHVVGDVFAPLARMISIDTLWYKEKYGRNHSQSFNPPMYFPVAKREFSSITIDIRDAFGDSISFDSDVLSVVLHFRRRRN